MRCLLIKESRVWQEVILCVTLPWILVSNNSARRHAGEERQNYFLKEKYPPTLTPRLIIATLPMHFWRLWVLNIPSKLSHLFHTFNYIFLCINPITSFRNIVRLIWSYFYLTSACMLCFGRLNVMCYFIYLFFQASKKPWIPTNTT